MTKEGYMTLVQVARELETGEKNVRGFITEGKLEAERDSQRWWVKEESVKEYMKAYGKPEHPRRGRRKKSYYE